MSRISAAAPVLCEPPLFNGAPNSNSTANTPAASLFMVMLTANSEDAPEQTNIRPTKNDALSLHVRPTAPTAPRARVQTDPAHGPATDHHTTLIFGAYLGLSGKRYTTGYRTTKTTPTTHEPGLGTAVIAVIAATPAPQKRKRPMWVARRTTHDGHRIGSTKSEVSKVGAGETMAKTQSTTKRGQSQSARQRIICECSTRR
ncbi:hypothetical protein B0H16DRAFT_1729943 [Mycena metata]|uniref:Uncharacterized protein n=1 Tax=Mycena metata TaxID=1033252 RepID=A0AAD7I9X0_9AGAR|nr:hypothetical protein B0H16DRAFT_1729943 [Mycena metata]